MPTVTVIIPAYNAERTIRDTIRSVMEQTFSDFELVVINDGSTDRTAQLVEAFGGPVSCVTTKNQGVASARNRGLQEARGDFVAFLDADDQWAPVKLERQLSVMFSDPGRGACFVGARRVDEHFRTTGYTPAGWHDDLCEALLLESMVVPAFSSNILLRRETAQEVGGFDSTFSQCADWDYCIRLSLATQLAPVDEPLVFYRTAPGNMSSDIGLLERDTFAVLQKFFASSDSARYLPIRRRCYSNHWMILSGSYLHEHQYGDALRCLYKGIRIYPANLRRPAGLPRRWIRRALASKAVA